MFTVKQQEKAPVPVEPEMTNEDDDSVTIYIWSSGFNSIGHVALQLDGKKEKYKRDDPGNYFSIWPQSTPAGGLTSIWPLKGTLARSLEDDCRQEAIRPKEDFSNLMEPAEILPVEPDKVFVVQGLDKKKMRDEFERIEQGLNTGEVRYQLLPGVKAMSFFNNLMSTNPNKIEVYNCVTLTEHLLEVGGAENLTKSPWTTPSKFATQLECQPRVKQREYSSFESNSEENQVDKSGGVKHSPSPTVSPSHGRFSNWFSDYYYEPTSETTESVSVIESESSPRVSDCSSSFFEQHHDEPQSYLQQREEESDLSYMLRMDALAN
ncbi:TPA: hypothetical protein ACTXXA_000768 [Legionella anisa]